MPRAAQSQTDKVHAHHAQVMHRAHGHMLDWQTRIMIKSNFLEKWNDKMEKWKMRKWIFARWNLIKCVMWTLASQQKVCLLRAHTHMHSIHTECDAKRLAPFQSKLIDFTARCALTMRHNELRTQRKIKENTYKIERERRDREVAGGRIYIGAADERSSISQMNIYYLMCALCALLCENFQHTSIACNCYIDSRLRHGAIPTSWLMAVEAMHTHLHNTKRHFFLFLLPRVNSHAP